MRKTVRKIMALVLMGVATFGLVACGSVEEKTGIETSGNAELYIIDGTG